MLTKIGARMNKKNEKGFTLIELMIVIAIIGILAAIAIPQFAAYRRRSYNSAAQADLRNAATAQEAYFVDFQKYTNNLTALTATDGGGLSQSANVTIAIPQNNVNGYQMTSFHSSGNKTYTLTGPGGTITDH